MKSKRFYFRRVSQAYIITVLLVQPYLVLEIYANFTYFNNINQIFKSTRPLEIFSVLLSHRGYFVRTKTP